MHVLLFSAPSTRRPAAVSATYITSSDLDKIKVLSYFSSEFLPYIFLYLAKDSY